MQDNKNNLNKIYKTINLRRIGWGSYNNKLNNNFKKRNRKSSSKEPNHNNKNSRKSTLAPRLWISTNPITHRTTEATTLT